MHCKHSKSSLKEKHSILMTHFGMKLLTRLRLDFSSLCKYKLKNYFKDRLFHVGLELKAQNLVSSSHISLRKIKLP